MLLTSDVRYRHGSDTYYLNGIAVETYKADK